MSRTKSIRTLALAGFVSAGKLSHAYRSLLPVLALCVTSAAWSQAIPRARGARVPPNMSGGAQPAKPAAVTPANSQYRFVTIEIPGAGATCGTSYFCDYAGGVNDAGLVTGQYLNTSSTYSGFAWQNGILHTLDYPGATDTHLEGVNNRGVAIGDYNPNETSTEYVVTYSFQSSAWAMLPNIPNTVYNEGYGVNDFGVAVGQAFGATGNVAWIWYPSSQSYSFFAVPGSTQYSTTPGLLNDKGQVVGQYQDSSGVWHGFLKEGESYTTIDPPDSTYTYAVGINNSGTIVGLWQNLSGWFEGFVRTSDGVFTAVNVPGGLETQIDAINDRGDICGDFVDPNTGQWTPFVAFKQ